MARPTDTHQGDARRLNHPVPPGDKGALRSHGRVGVDSFPRTADGSGHKAVPAARDVAPDTRAKFAELLAVITEHAGDTVAPIDVDRLRAAFEFAAGRHGKQQRRTGED